jgi:hypothetical protein
VNVFLWVVLEITRKTISAGASARPQGTRSGEGLRSRYSFTLCSKLSPTDGVPTSRGSFGEKAALNAHLEHEDGKVVFRHACKLGLEGIVSKRKGSPYRSGRSADWLKMKNPEAPAVKREAEEDWRR